MENIALGLSTTGLGMLVVFLGLIFLMYIMIGLAGVSRFGAKKPAAPKADGGKTVDVSPAPAQIEQEAKPEPVAMDAAEEEMAAIAAVVAILTSEGIGATISAVKRTGASQTPWAYAGRRDVMASRL